MEAHVRTAVWERAAHRCEYCLLRQEHLAFARFHQLLEFNAPRRLRLRARLLASAEM
ncbi:MAG: hypothetical protein AB9869_33380 [Verrucomicrobiia bacterium]